MWSCSGYGIRLTYDITRDSEQMANTLFVKERKSAYRKNQLFFHALARMSASKTDVKYQTVSPTKEAYSEWPTKQRKGQIVRQLRIFIA